MRAPRTKQRPLAELACSLALVSTSACRTEHLPSTASAAAEPAPSGTALARRTDAIPACTEPMTFVRVPAPKPFWISTTEVTWDAFDAYVYKKDQQDGHVNATVDAVTRPSQPYNPMDRGFGHAGYPAISMSFANAQGFCAWLSAHTGKHYRLPTEAEWELAARAGETAPFIGGSEPELPRYAWLAAETRDKTQPVARKTPNAFGLHDVIGNAGEWCVAPDGSGVMRGGTYQSTSAEARFDARVPATPEWNRHDPQIPKSKWWLIDGGFVGFRVVCEDGP